MALRTDVEAMSPSGIGRKPRWLPSLTVIVESAAVKTRNAASRVIQPCGPTREHRIRALDDQLRTGGRGSGGPPRIARRFFFVDE